VSRSARALALLLAALTAAAGPAVAQTGPAAARATPPPTIGSTHSRGFCDTVRDNVAPSVLGLMKNDALIGAGHRAFAKMAHDTTTSSSAALDLDRVYLAQVVHALAHNVATIDTLLADQRRFPKTPASDDDELAAQLAAQLRAARDRQNDALNLIDGTLETEQMGQMRQDVSQQMQSAVGPSMAPTADAPSPAPNFLDTAGLPSYSAIAAFDPRTLATSGTLGNTPYDRVLHALDYDQARIAGAEQVLSPTIVAAALGCQAGASPVPTAAP
jgi:hypothetical protein